MTSSEHIRRSIEQVAAYLADHPEVARSTDSTASAVMEGGLRARVVGPGGVTVHSDMPTAVGGGGTAPSPGWLLRAALAACDATLVAMEAARVGLELASLEVEVGSESDDRGLLGVGDGIPAGPLAVRTVIRVAVSAADQERLAAVLAAAEAHSPVADALRRSVAVETRVERA